jgi:4-amino-4-deoxy-L-arabinose transferase-like glycosyltransferase
VDPEAAALDPAPDPASGAARPPGRLWPRVALALVLALAAALRLWRLDQNGFDNEYYAAAVRSMMGDWHTFFNNSFDPAGFVSVDKPPLALWIQVATAKVLGFSSLAVLLPQVR